MLLIYFLGLFDTGSPIFIQTRVGQHKRPFRLYKFRTMAVETGDIATHLVDRQSVTTLGKFLRRTKLDELPQLLNVLRGEMSFVGPRPCLPVQKELIEEREALGVFRVKPGITGLAQVKGIDMSNPKSLALVDQQMITSLSVGKYLTYILITGLGAGRGDRTNSL